MAKSNRREFLALLAGVGAGSITGFVIGKFPQYQPTTSGHLINSKVLTGTVSKVQERPRNTGADFGNIGFYPVLIKGADGRNYLIPYLQPPFNLQMLYENLKDGDTIAVEIYTEGPYSGYPKTMPAIRKSIQV